MQVSTGHGIADVPQITCHRGHSERHSAPPRAGSIIQARSVPAARRKEFAGSSKIRWASTTHRTAHA
eukprot:2312506-Rhodomonas_salina.2